MKTKSNILFSLAAILFLSFNVQAQKTIIKKDALPAAAKNFLKTNFKNLEPSYIVQENKILSKEYTVRYSSNIEIDFDKNGKWKEVDGNHNPIPSGIAPKTIQTYIQTNFAKEKITSIEKKSSGYEVKLMNGLELKFNSSGKFIKIDE